MMLSAALVSYFFVACHSFKSHQIISLPGITTLQSNQYSGYLSASNNRSHLHYWFVESEFNPESAPVVLWLNGGPGCSSLDGFFYEQGPFELSYDGDKIFSRQYRWNRIANMLFLEAPVGVGFSYNDDLNYANSDDRTATENMEAIESFFELFPQYKTNNFYLTGESYAGIYIPTLAEAILTSSSYTGAALTGIAVGNGCTGKDIGICGWYFGDNAIKSEIATECDWQSCLASTTPLASSNNSILSSKCLDLLHAASGELGAVNIYNVYGDCPMQACAGPSDSHSNTRLGPVELPAKDVSRQLSYQETVTKLTADFRDLKSRIMQGQGRLQAAHTALATDSGADNTVYGPVGCIDSAAATNYLMRADVQAAIHVKAPGFCWAVCNRAKQFSYNVTRSNLPRDLYPFLISKIQVLIYNGDWDACVPVTDNEAWTENMGYPVLKPWSAWPYTSIHNTSQIGGYAVSYDVQSLGAGSFEFKTVRGSGHMVPTDAPAQAFQMFATFIGADIDHINFLDDAATGCASDVGQVPESSAARHRRWALTTLVCLLSAGVMLVVVYLTYEIKSLRARLAMLRNQNATGGRGGGAVSIEFSGSNNPVLDSNKAVLSATALPYHRVQASDDSTHL